MLVHTGSAVRHQALAEIGVTIARNVEGVMGRASRRKKERRRGEERFGSRRIDSPGRRTISLDEDSVAGHEIAGALDKQLLAFRAKFGRDPAPDDPIIFDPDADEPTPLGPERIETAMVEVLRQAGFDNAYIYAYQVTGLLPTEMNRHLLSDEDMEEFEEAMERYVALHET